MVMLSLIIYWLALFVLFYTYAGYGILMWAYNGIKGSWRNTVTGEGGTLSLTVIIPAFNEAAVLGAKIRNTLQLHYPHGQLKVLVVTDGSDDGSDAIAKAFPQVKLLHQEQRQGKASAINRAMKEVDTELVVLTDANTFLQPDCLSWMVAHYADEKVGGVSGEKRVGGNGDETLSAGGEGLYWKYESFLKRNDAEAGTLVGAAGELFSFRQRLFNPLESDTVLDDFVLSLRICLQGYRVAYEPRALASESASPTMGAEWKRKVRICAGGFQAMKRLPGLLQVSRHPMLSFQYISHRVLRWTVAPVCLAIILFTNIILVIEKTGSWFDLTLLLQVLFYLSGLLGWLGARYNRKLPIVYIPYYFLMMNAATMAGFIRFASGKQSVIWEKSDRLSIPVN